MEGFGAGELDIEFLCFAFNRHIIPHKNTPKEQVLCTSRRMCFDGLFILYEVLLYFVYDTR